MECSLVIIADGYLNVWHYKNLNFIVPMKTSHDVKNKEKASQPFVVMFHNVYDDHFSS